MFKKFIPFAHATSIYEIPADFYKGQGVNLLLVDLDNTLDSYRLNIPTQRAIDLVKALLDTGLKVVIVSNNRGKRVKTYASNIGLPCINSARKPFSGKIKAFLKENNYSPEETMLVGDQMITDVLAARGAHIRVILTEKIVKEDQWTTHINRLFDRPIRKHLKKKGKLPDWRTKYGQIK